MVLSNELKLFSILVNIIQVVLRSALYRVIHKACSPPFSSIMHLNKIRFLKFWNISLGIKSHICKIFVLLKECPDLTFHGDTNLYFSNFFSFSTVNSSENLTNQNQNLFE